MVIAMLQDMSRCVGCKACQVACKEWNELPAESTRNHGDYENPPDLSATTWTRVQFLELEDRDTVRWRFFKHQCMHCMDAECVEVCPTSALTHNAAGFVSLERERCDGCGDCVRACPFGVLRLEVSARKGRAKAAKCTLCQDRVTTGNIPACAKACPTGALEFGDREILVARARARVAELRAAGYREALLYGERELGGCGVIYVLPESRSRYPVLASAPETPSPRASTRPRVPEPFRASSLAFGAVCLVANFLVGRRLHSGRKDEE